jgi:hypothetical protein
MLFWIFIGLLVIGLTLLWWDEIRSGFRFGIGDTLGSSISGAIVYSIVTVTILFICSMPSCAWEDIGEIDHQSGELISITRDQSISGSFFLGCGSIGSSSYYVFYQKNGNGGYRLEKIRTNNADIYMSNDETPRWGRSYHGKNLGWWVVPWKMQRRVGQRYYIFVPEGTIIQDFRLE